MKLTIKKIFRECGPPVYQLTQWPGGRFVYVGTVVDDFYTYEAAEKKMNQMVYAERRRRELDKRNSTSPYLAEVTI